MEKAKQYERLEFSLKELKNADKIEVITPNGSAEYVFPFLYQPIDISYDGMGIEHIKPNGNTYLKFRYTLKSIGNYKFNVYADSKLLDTYEVISEESDLHGFVKVSDKDRRYFEYSDKTSFLPIGLNAVHATAYEASDGSEFGTTDNIIYVGLKQYESWFRKCKKNGVNLIRLWLGHKYFSPDTEEVGVLKYEQFTKLDMLIELAEKYGIKLKFTLEHFRFFSKNHVGIAKIFEKTLHLNGKSCPSMSEWITDSKWKDGWFFKVNEIAKRYAGDTNIFAFEFWNEMNCVDCDFGDVIAWNKEMLERTKKVVHDNMIINSLGSFDCDLVENEYSRFPWEEFSFKQVHSYLDCGAEKEVCRHSLIDLMEDNFKKHIPKDIPVVISETGAVNNCHSGPFRYYASDDNGIIFADAIYSPFFMGSAGCGQIWHWETYVENKKLFSMYKPFHELTKNINLAEEHFISKNLSNDETYALVLEGDNHILVYIRNRCDNWENTLRDLNDVKSVDFDLKIGRYSNVKEYKIWDEDIILERYSDGVKINQITHGLFLKFEKMYN